MKSILSAVIIGLSAVQGQAQTLFSPDLPLMVFEAGDADLNEFMWKFRPIVVFADTPDDPAFIEQMERLAAGAQELTERDVVVIIDTDPAARSAIRLKLRPRGFMLTIIGKDGEVALRKPFPWSVREISRSVDKMPMRQREIRDAKEAPEG